MKLVLDVGSGASLPDADTACRFVDAIKAVDSGAHEIVLKAQLFKAAPPNTPLAWPTFRTLYDYGKERGYQVTASVFDAESLMYLLTFDVPFVKIACRPSLYWLAGEVPRKVPVWVSVERDPRDREENGEWLACVPKYPATDLDYRLEFPEDAQCVSDHTVGWDMLNDWCTVKMMGPRIWEKHFILPTTKGPDVGPWAVTPEQLKEIM